MRIPAFDDVTKRPYADLAGPGCRNGRGTEERYGEVPVRLDD